MSYLYIGEKMGEEKMYGSSGKTHISQFFDNTVDINSVRYDESTSATRDFEEYIITYGDNK